MNVLKMNTSFVGMWKHGCLGITPAKSIDSTLLGFPENWSWQSIAKRGSMPTSMDDYGLKDENLGPPLQAASYLADCPQLLAM